MGHVDPYKESRATACGRSRLRRKKSYVEGEGRNEV